MSRFGGVAGRISDRARIQLAVVVRSPETNEYVRQSIRDVLDTEGRGVEEFLEGFVLVVLPSAITDELIEQYPAAGNEEMAELSKDGFG